jgi:hypothetical protein
MYKLRGLSRDTGLNIYAHYGEKGFYIAIAFKGKIAAGPVFYGKSGREKGKEKFVRVLRVRNQLNLKF